MVMAVVWGEVTTARRRLRRLRWRRGAARLAALRPLHGSGGGHLTLLVVGGRHDPGLPGLGQRDLPPRRLRLSITSPYSIITVPHHSREYRKGGADLPPPDLRLALLVHRLAVPATSEGPYSSRIQRGYSEHSYRTHTTMGPAGGGRRTRRSDRWPFSCPAAARAFSTSSLCETP